MRKIIPILIASFLTCQGTLACTPTPPDGTSPIEGRSQWLVVDDFESASDVALESWTHVDTQNETKPFVENPQIAERRAEADPENHYLLKKPAADGVIGNRKALGFKALPIEIPVGETYTMYTRINVEYFPNNHSFGLSNLASTDIIEQNYDSFEPMIRITDKAESDGSRNDGTLMVLSGYKTYSKILNPKSDAPAKPLIPGTWYELWYVVNNASQDKGGQTYDLYARGGEFLTQQRVFSSAVFRMKREAPLKFFMTISNTGPHDGPYGNGGVRYDDIYMTPGVILSSPLKTARSSR